MNDDEIEIKTQSDLPKVKSLQLIELEIKLFDL